MSRYYPSSPSKASGVFEQRFNLEQATAFGGLNQLASFLRKLGIDRKLSRRFRKAKAPWSRWSLNRTLRLLLDCCFVGIERLYHFEDLETEPMLCAQHGVERLLDLKSLYRELRRFEEPALWSSLSGLLREVVEEDLTGQDSAALEIDSTVETLYGHQEGAEVGPNPHKPGRPSYHPLIARDRNSGLVIHHKLRPGDRGTASDIVSFLHQTIDIVKESGIRTILARLDSGFECDPALRVLERRGVGYVVKMRATWKLAGYPCQFFPQSWRWVDFGGDGEIQVASFQWQRSSAWKQHRRVIAVRRRDLDRLQGHLFDSEGWSYSFLVTNLDWEPCDIVRFYDKRADVERTVCELKDDLHIDHVPTASFAANAADLAIKILAHNLLVLYRRRGLKLATRHRVMTLRRRFIVVPGRLVRHAGKLVLRLASNSPLRPLAEAPLAEAHPLTG